jgi:hypothetical protein
VRYFPGVVTSRLRESLCSTINLPSTENALLTCRNQGRLALKIVPCVRHAAEMHLFRRAPEPVHHAYEVQIFSCMKCDAEMTRSADRKGRPHSSAVSIELETS